MVSAWLAAGHRVSTLVVGHPDPLAQDCWRPFVDQGIRIIGTPYPVDWGWLTTRLGLDAQAADVLLCYAFMNKIPQALLNAHRHGGLNFHPSLLPHYHGPHPIRCMVADGTTGLYAGVSLHVMTDEYDRGDLLAQASMTPADFSDIRRCRRALASHISRLAVEAVPAFCAGKLQPVPQSGEGCEARHVPEEVRMSGSTWSAADIRAACAVLSRKSRLLLTTEDHPTAIRISGIWREVAGRATGQPTRIRWHAVEADCTDKRLMLWRNTLIARLVRRCMTSLRRS